MLKIVERKESSKTEDNETLKALLIKIVWFLIPNIFFWTYLSILFIWMNWGINW